MLSTSYVQVPGIFLYRQRNDGKDNDNDNDNDNETATLRDLNKEINRNHAIYPKKKLTMIETTQDSGSVRLNKHNNNSKSNNSNNKSANEEHKEKH